MATLAENAAAVKAAQLAIDAAIIDKGGTTAGGLSNAAAAIAALPSGGSDNLGGLIDGSLTEIEVPGIKEISTSALCSSGSSASYSRPLTKAYFPDVVTVGYAAFRYDRYLKVVRIPKAEKIDGHAFNYCAGLEFVDLTGVKKVTTLVNSNAFTNTSSNYKVIVPASLLAAFKSATNWSNISAHIVDSAYTDDHVVSLEYRGAGITVESYKTTATGTFAATHEAINVLTGAPETYVENVDLTSSGFGTNESASDRDVDAVFTYGGQTITLVVRQKAKSRTYSVKYSDDYSFDPGGDVSSTVLTFTDNVSGASVTTSVSDVENPSASRGKTIMTGINSVTVAKNSGGEFTLKINGSYINNARGSFDLTDDVYITYCSRVD